MPPFVAFSIGSFGDILAVLQLLYRLRDALNELTGAAAEMRVLIDDIDRMSRALIQVKAALERRGSQIQADVANGIRVAVATCEDILRAALGAIEDFKRRIISATGPSGWRAYCAVLGWSVLGGKQRVEALRARLAEQIDVIQLYLALSHSCGQANIQECLESQGATLRRLCDVVQDIQLRFDVGIPSFMFWDGANGHYCAPLARTSLDRLREIYDNYSGDGCLLDRPENGNPARRLSLRFMRFRSSSERPVVSVCRLPEGFRPSIDCFVFQERAFGQWQALVSLPIYTDEVADFAPVIKILLERPHGLKHPCNCRGESCHSKLRHVFERRAKHRQRLEDYGAAAQALVASIFEAKHRSPEDPAPHGSREHVLSENIHLMFLKVIWAVELQVRWDRTSDAEMFRSAFHRLPRGVWERLISGLPYTHFKDEHRFVVVHTIPGGETAFVNPVECFLDMI